jgi:hypothetical protein
MFNPTITAQFAVVPYGPVELEGFLMPDGQFRQSLSSTARSIGLRDRGRNLARDILPRIAAENTPEGQNADEPKGLARFTGKKAGAQILEVPTGMPGFAAKADTIDLTTVIAVWRHIATSPSKYAAQAAELLSIGARVSLEGVYREAFGMAADGRSMEEQLLHAWLKP